MQQQLSRDTNSTGCMWTLSSRSVSFNSHIHFHTCVLVFAASRRRFDLCFHFLVLNPVARQQRASGSCSDDEHKLPESDSNPEISSSAAEPASDRKHEELRMYRVSVYGMVEDVLMKLTTCMKLQTFVLLQVSAPSCSFSALFCVKTSP